MAVSQILHPPRAVFLDYDGSPLAGGFVYTYSSGTNTPKTTWADGAQSIPNTNPIVLDADGSAGIFGNGSYQISVTDADGNPVPRYSGLTDAYIPAAPPAVPISAAMAAFCLADTLADALVELSTPVLADFGTPAFSASASGATNGIIGQITNNLPPNTFAFPTGVTGYGVMNCAGGQAFGVFGRADLRSAGTALNELDSFNFAGSPAGTLPPNLGFGTTDRNAIALLLAAYGTSPSSLGLYLARGDQPFQSGIYIAPGAVQTYGLFIDANGVAGPAGIAAVIKSPPGGVNLSLQSGGTYSAGSAVLQVVAATGTVKAVLRQDGSFTNDGITLQQDGKIAFRTPSLSNTADPGSGGAVPANAQGYLIANIGGSDFKIPYFN